MRSLRSLYVTIDQCVYYFSATKVRFSIFKTSSVSLNPKVNKSTACGCQRSAVAAFGTNLDHTNWKYLGNFPLPPTQEGQLHLLAKVWAVSTGKPLRSKLTRLLIKYG